MTRLDFASQRLFVDAPLSEGARVELSREQSNYLFNVLRLSEGARLLVFNGRDGEWRARLAPGGRKTAALLVETRTRAQEPLPDIDYLFAPLKHARLDYMTQKAVEMGARRLRPVLTRHTQTSRLNLERMRANVVEAAEQCGILALPEVLAEERLDKVSIDNRDTPYTKVRKLAKRHRTCSAQANNTDVEVAKYSLTGVTKREALS